MTANAQDLGPLSPPLTQPSTSPRWLACTGRAYDRIARHVALPERQP
jgi:hypothetical protein